MSPAGLYQVKGPVRKPDLRKMNRGKSWEEKVRARPEGAVHQGCKKQGLAAETLMLFFQQKGGKGRGTWQKEHSRVHLPK